MSEEQEIRFGGADGSASNQDDGADGPNLERLRSLRGQADAFNAAASRAFRFAQSQDSSPKQILDSIRNTGGQ